MKLEYLIPSLIVIGLLSALAFAQQQATITTSATISPYISVVWSYNTVDFGTVYVNSANNVPVNLNQSLGEFYANITTNSNYTISAKVSGLPSGFTHKFLAWPSIDGLIPEKAKVLTETYQEIFTQTGVPMLGTFTNYHANWLDVGFVEAKQYSWTLYERYENI
jgi:hypothetical protein